MPIYRKNYMPRARKNSLLGLNWYTQASNTFSKNGKTTTGVAGVKKTIHQLIMDNKEAILAEAVDWIAEHTDNGFHAHYKVYLGRLGSDGHNVRSAMEKMILDGVEEAGLIDNDRYVYTTSTECYLQRSDPRIEVEITHKKDYKFIID